MSVSRPRTLPAHHHAFTRIYMSTRKLAIIGMCARLLVRRAIGLNWDGRPVGHHGQRAPGAEEPVSAWPYRIGRTPTGRRGPSRSAAGGGSGLVSVRSIAAKLDDPGDSACRYCLMVLSFVISSRFAARAATSSSLRSSSCRRRPMICSWWSASCCWRPRTSSGAPRPLVR
jgi:hypothetical protein